MFIRESMFRVRTCSIAWHVNWAKGNPWMTFFTSLACGSRAYIPSLLSLDSLFHRHFMHSLSSFFFPLSRSHLTHTYRYHRGLSTSDWSPWSGVYANAPAYDLPTHRARRMYKETPKRVNTDNYAICASAHVRQFCIIPKLLVVYLYFFKSNSSNDEGSASEIWHSLKTEIFVRFISIFSKFISLKQKLTSCQKNNTINCFIYGLIE